MKNFVDKQKVKIKKIAEETLDEKILNCFFVHTGSLKLSEKSDDIK